MSIVARSMSTPTDSPQAAVPAFHPSGAPWEVICGTLALTSAIIGLEWDIAWHSSIGRDTFWTPAHMMVYLCGVLTAIACGYLVLATTFGRSAAMRVHSVGIFGFRAPLGGFLATWGGLAMLVSAPFDDWWHSAYGLDVQVISPPHVLLFIGLAMIALGFLLLAGSVMNRIGFVARNELAGLPGAESAGETRAFAQDSAPGTLQTLFLYIGGLNLMMYMIIFEQRIELWELHNSVPYKTLAASVPFLFALLSRSSRSRWAATSAASVYSIIRILAIQILPLVPATPKLGPVYTPVTHLVPAEFPILVIVPAIALDLLWQHTPRMKLWLTSVLSGLVFTAALVAAEWPFADFLISKTAANRFFGTMYVGYSTHVADRAPHLAGVQRGWTLVHGLLIASLLAMVASWMGLVFGRWMRDLQR